MANEIIIKFNEGFLRQSTAYGYVQDISNTNQIQASYLTLTPGKTLGPALQETQDLFVYVLAGFGTLTVVDRTYAVRPGDRVTVMMGQEFSFMSGPNYDLVLMAVTCPAAAGIETPPEEPQPEEPEEPIDEEEEIPDDTETP